MLINTMKDLGQALRAGPYAWPGGYPLYFVMADGEALSFKAAWAERRLLFEAWRDKAKGWPDSGNQWLVAAMEINHEDADLICVHSGERIEAAYGDEGKEG